MPSVVLEASGIQNKRGLEAADPESWSTLCSAPEKERLVSHRSPSFQKHLILFKIQRRKGLIWTWRSPSFWSWWNSEPGLWRTAREPIVAGCSVANGLLWAGTEVSWSQTRFLKENKKKQKCYLRTFWFLQSYKESKVCCSQSHFLTFLCLFFLTAAIVEVNMVCGHLQAARNNCHDGDELTVLRQNQFLFLALVLSLHPKSAGEGYTIYIFWSVYLHTAGTK